MWRVDSFEKTLMLEGLGAGEEGDDRGWDGWMASLTRCTWVWMNSESWWWTGRPGVLRFMGSQSWTWLSDWTELNWYYILDDFGCLIVSQSLSKIKIHHSSYLCTQSVLSAYLTCMQSTSWEMLGWKKRKLESRSPGEISITSDKQMTPPLWQKVKRS